MNLSQIKSDIEAGFNDAATLLGWINEAVPTLEKVVPQDAAEIQAVQDAANKIAPLVSGLLASNDIDQPTHDALQARVATVVTPVAAPPTPPAAPGVAAAIVAILALFLFAGSVRAQTITVNGVSVPILSGGLVSAQDISNAEATANAVESSTNETSFTNTSLFIGSGYEDNVNNAQDSYLSVDYRVFKSANFSFELGASAVMNTTGNGLHDADVRFDLLKDISNFQVYGGLLGGRTFDGAVGYYAGLNGGVRYNLTASLAQTSNPILNFIAGSGKVNTYVQTELDVDAPLSKISGGLSIDKVWRFGVGFAF